MKSIKRLKLVLILFLIIFSFFRIANAMDINSYPLNKSDRSLTVPEKMHQYSLGMGLSRSDNGYDFIPNFSYEYGITDNLTLDLIGLKYRFLDSEYPVEIAARTGIGELSFAISEKGKEFKLTTYNYVEGKQRFSKYFYTKYLLFYEKIIRDTEGAEIWTSGFGIGAYYLYTDRFETGLLAFYDFIDGFKERQRAERLGLSMIYTYSQTLDIGLKISASGFATEIATGENPYNDKISCSLLFTGRMVWQ